MPSRATCRLADLTSRSRRSAPSSPARSRAVGRRLQRGAAAVVSIGLAAAGSADRRARDDRRHHFVIVIPVADSPQQLRPASTACSSSATLTATAACATAAGKSCGADRRRQRRTPACIAAHRALAARIQPRGLAMQSFRPRRAACAAGLAAPTASTCHGIVGTTRRRSFRPQGPGRDAQPRLPEARRNAQARRRRPALLHRSTRPGLPGEGRHRRRRPRRLRGRISSTSSTPSSARTDAPGADRQGGRRPAGFARGDGRQLPRRRDRLPARDGRGAIRRRPAVSHAPSAQASGRGRLSRHGRPVRLPPGRCDAYRYPLPARRRAQRGRLLRRISPRGCNSFFHGEHPDPRLLLPACRPLAQRAAGAHRLHRQLRVPARGPELVHPLRAAAPAHVRPDARAHC